MTSHFFILGLPRSRTAWLANWFTYGRSFCLHDAGRFAPDVDRLEATLGQVAAERDLAYVGSSDSSNGLIFDGLVERFPDARLLLVERDLEESVAWAAQHDMDVEAVRTLHERHQRIKESRCVMALPYRELDVRMAHAWLTPDEPFDELRFLQLDGLNITVDLSRYYDWCEVN